MTGTWHVYWLSQVDLVSRQEFVDSSDNLYQLGSMRDWTFFFVVVEDLEVLRWICHLLLIISQIDVNDNFNSSVAKLETIQTYDTDGDDLKLTCNLWITMNSNWHWNWKYNYKHLKSDVHTTSSSQVVIEIGWNIQEYWLQKINSMKKKYQTRDMRKSFICLFSLRKSQSRHPSWAIQIYSIHFYFSTQCQWNLIHCSIYILQIVITVFRYFFHLEDLCPDLNNKQCFLFRKMT